jgi:L-ascorbate metabolism protein UlaG (beta-lactamase superfamily)
MVIRSSRHGAFFSGDTGLTTEFSSIHERLGPFDLTLLEGGGHHPSWGDIHLGPDNALRALALLGGGTFMPIHWGTFALATHDWDQPPERLLARAPEEGVRLLMPRLGEAVEPGHERGGTVVVCGR